MYLIKHHQGGFVKNASLMTLLVLFLAYSSLLSAECQSRILVTKLDKRYTDRDNGMIIDTDTGLVWEKCTAGLSGNACQNGHALKMNWVTALNIANDNVFGGYSDWRLPNKKELASLVEKACFSPAINTVFFPAVEADLYWTSSPYAGAADEAWIVDFDVGYGDAMPKSSLAYVRFVRGGY